jgi:hypothetical protein
MKKRRLAALVVHWAGPCRMTCHQLAFLFFTADVFVPVESAKLSS